MRWQMCIEHSAQCLVPNEISTVCHGPSVGLGTTTPSRTGYLPSRWRRSSGSLCSLCKFTKPLFFDRRVWMDVTQLSLSCKIR